MLSDSTYTRHLEQEHSPTQKTGWWVPGAGGGKEQESLFNEDRVSIGERRKVLETEGGDGCTTG